MKWLTALVFGMLSPPVVAAPHGPAWYESAHFIAETYPSKPQALRLLGRPGKEVTFVFAESHKLKLPNLQCQLPPNDANVTALYYSFDGDAIGYWFFFIGEQMLCFSGRTSVKALSEWYKP